MPWATADDVKAAVADHLARDKSLAFSDSNPRALTLRWESIITRSLARAITDLRNFVVGRSFTAVQLAGWDDAYQYSLDQAFYYAIIEGASPDDQSDRDVSRFDRIKLMMKGDDPLALMINGVMVVAGGEDNGGAIGGGTLTPAPDGVNYGDLFGVSSRRQPGGLNQYGDDISPGEW
jgi:hypothetical protein